VITCSWLDYQAQVGCALRRLTIRTARLAVPPNSVRLQDPLSA
jgi:hypothetical protein